MGVPNPISIPRLIDNLSVSGPVQGPQKMQHIVDKTRDVMNSFIKAMEELAILRENLARTEVIKSRSTASAQLTAHAD